MAQTKQQRHESGAEAGTSDREYEVGARVLCRASFDKQYHAAEIVERKLDGSTSAVCSYYVHYAEFDRRLDEWVSPASLRPPALGPAPSGGAPGGGDALAADQKLTRRLKRQYAETHHVAPGVEALPPAEQHAEREHQEKTRVKNVQRVELGAWELDAWYYSPYPEPYASCEQLFICEYTLKYFRKRRTLLRHLAKCSTFHPPGDEIYRSPALGETSRAGGRGAPVTAPQPALSVFEVDGRQAKVYCQNLCLLSKLFLDHKTLYYDVDPFLFYVLCERDAQGRHHVAGYFSKEKESLEGNNVACILTLPPYQRRGYGRFLIAFSYELSKREGRVGSPERPLSDLGAVSYRSYWTRTVLQALYERRADMSLKDISEATSMRLDDVVRTLESLGLIKYWKGDHIISVTARVVEEHLRALPEVRSIEIDPTRLHWVPHGRPEAAGTRRF